MPKFKGNRLIRSTDYDALGVNTYERVKNGIRETVTQFGIANDEEKTVDRVSVWLKVDSSLKPKTEIAFLSSALYEEDTEKK